MDKEHIAVLAFLALAVSGGACLTAWHCRRAPKGVDWHRTLAGTFVAGLVTAIFVWFGYLLPLAELGPGESVLRLVLLAFMWACGFAFVPAVLTVRYYKRKLSSKASQTHLLVE